MSFDIDLERFFLGRLLEDGDDDLRSFGAALVQAMLSGTNTHDEASRLQHYGVRLVASEPRAAMGEPIEAKAKAEAVADSDERRSGLTLNVAATPGLNDRQIAVELTMLATDLQVFVATKQRGLAMRAWPGADPDQVLAKFERDERLSFYPKN
jgi:hypothetical protein